MCHHGIRWHTPGDRPQSHHAQTEAILKGSPIFSTFAVDDIDTARRFYQDTLGLDVRDRRMPGLLRSTVPIGRR
jgi:hypothetical protein